MISHPLLNWVLARQDFETRTQFSSGWDRAHIRVRLDRHMAYIKLIQLTILR